MNSTSSTASGGARTAASRSNSNVSKHEGQQQQQKNGDDLPWNNLLGSLQYELPTFSCGRRRFSRFRSAKTMRVVTLTLLAISTVILTTVSFTLSRGREKHDFNEQFDSYAKQIFAGFRSSFEKKLLALDSFSVDITSYAKTADLTWPEVTVPDFAVKGYTLRQQLEAETVGILPIVTKDSRESWEAYALDQQDWVVNARTWENNQGGSPPSESRRRNLRQRIIASPQEDGGYENLHATKRTLDQSEPEEVSFSKGIADHIYSVSNEGKAIIDGGNGPFTPVWMTSPAPKKLSPLNFNLLSHQYFWSGIESAVDSRQAVLSKVINFDSIQLTIAGHTPLNPHEPISAFYYPIFDTFESDTSTVVGILASEVAWAHFFDRSLPDTAVGIICVIENACGQAFSFRIDGPAVTYLGRGDKHDAEFNPMVRSMGIEYLSDFPRTFAGLPFQFEHCPFTLHVYPSSSLASEYNSSDSALFASSIVALFFVAVACFIVYDGMAGRRKLGDGSTAVVLERTFPQAVVRPSLKERVLSKLKRPAPDPNLIVGAAPAHFKATIRALPGSDRNKNNTDPFSDATVMFADIAGLDAWASRKKIQEKEDLFESVHRSFNAIAKRYGIFQVEIAGDCFVAVTGVQESENDHAVIMSQFACECRKRMKDVFRGVSGGRNLSMRFGLHSGHVQAGLFGNENSRFQLFGDTVDTTYQMLTNGRSNKIHVSVETAELLNLAGKPHWISPRREVILVKGKGEMSTFWIKTKECLATDESSRSSSLFTKSDSSTVSNSTADDSELWEDDVQCVDGPDQEQAATCRFQSAIERSVTILLFYLKKIQSKRMALRQYSQRARPREANAEIGMGEPIIEEARELVRMPQFEVNVITHMHRFDFEEIPEEVEDQLRLYVTSIASSYRPNEFHNFEHATHATVTMDKILKKILNPNEPEAYVDFGGKPRSAEAVASELDVRTFGIASDPLTQFALVFSTLVHDVDHMGVSNYQLIKEKAPIAALYKNKSVAEQNSVDIAWWLLMTPNFEEFRTAIYGDAVEMRRFRQLLVNSVIATDILDVELKVYRDKGWERAFVRGRADFGHIRDLKATLTSEHLVQVADVAHTIQGYRVYLKWSEKLFHEMYRAFHSGRAEKDPSNSWFAAELAFFDKVVLPLATRLVQCGVCGTAGDEFLNNAKENRRLWSENGKKVVTDMVEAYNRKIVSGQEDTILFTVDNL